MTAGLRQTERAYRRSARLDRTGKSCDKTNPNEPASAGASVPALPLIRRRPPKPTAVFNSYWKFAAERQSVFHRRVLGQPGPWTDDPVIAKYKFTNAYRAADRVSQYLIRNVIYAGAYDLRDTVFRILLFKIFNKVRTWQLLQATHGDLTVKGFDAVRFGCTLDRALEAGEAIYSAAYIMPSGPASIRQPRKHMMHLRLIEQVLRANMPEHLAEAGTLEAAYELLHGLPSLGPFLAYQFVTDLNYSEHFSFSEMEFVVPGPGARDGMRKCFTSLGDYTEADAIRWVANRQAEEFERRGLNFLSLWGRPLQLIDCQNLFCEVDKYARVVHPDIVGYSGRTRIKQKFDPDPAPLQPWFPPKWGINDRLPVVLQPTTGPSLL